jgi:hypothetical protein
LHGNTIGGFGCEAWEKEIDKRIVAMVWTRMSGREKIVHRLRSEIAYAWLG